jgi:hypothetical protein
MYLFMFLINCLDNKKNTEPLCLNLTFYNFIFFKPMVPSYELKGSLFVFPPKMYHTVMFIFHLNYILSKVKMLAKNRQSNCKDILSRIGYAGDSLQSYRI